MCLIPATSERNSPFVSDEASHLEAEAALPGVLRRIGKNFSVLVLGQIVAGITLLWSTMYLGRVLGPENFGKISYPEAILLFSMIASNFGLDLVGIREVARRPELANVYARSISLLRFCLSLLVLGVIAVLSYSIPAAPDARKLVLLYGLTLLPLAFSLEWLFHGIQKMQYHAAVLSFVRDAGDLLLVPLFYLASRTIATLMLVVCFVLRFGWFRRAISGSMWRTLLKQSWPVGLSQTLVVLLYVSGIWLLTWMRDYEQVGYYTVVAKYVTGLLMLSAAFSAAVFPAAAKFHKQSLPALKRLIAFAVKLSVAASVVVLLCGLTLSETAVKLLYPKGDFAASAPVLSVLSAALACAIICTIYARTLLACDAQKLYLVVAGFQVVVCLSVSVALIPRHGALGAAFGPLAAEAVGIIGCWLALRRVLHRPQGATSAGAEEKRELKSED